jgi:uncharacterized membrane protein
VGEVAALEMAVRAGQDHTKHQVHSTLVEQQMAVQMLLHMATVVVDVLSVILYKTIDVHPTQLTQHQAAQVELAVEVKAIIRQHRMDRLGLLAVQMLDQVGLAQMAHPLVRLALKEAVAQTET